MVYWARMTGKGSEIGRLQRWLLADIGRAARICNPFSACGHSYLLRSRSAIAEAVRLTASASNVNIDPVLSGMIKDLVAMPPSTDLEPEVRAGFAAVLAASALDLRLHEQVRVLFCFSLPVTDITIFVFVGSNCTGERIDFRCMIRCCFLAFAGCSLCFDRIDRILMHEALELFRSDNEHIYSPVLSTVGVFSHAYAVKHLKHRHSCRH